MWKHQIVHAIVRPASVSAFTIPSRTSEDGSISTSTVSYIGSSVVFHGFTEQCRCWRRRRGEGEFCLFSIWIRLQVDRIATLLPTTTSTNRRGRSYIYTLPLAHPPTRVSTTAATGACALVGFEGGMDIDVASTASLSLRRSGSGSTLGVEGRQDRVQSQDRGQSQSRGMNRKRRRRKTIVESEWWFEVEFRFEG